MFIILWWRRPFKFWLTFHLCFGHTSRMIMREVVQRVLLWIHVILAFAGSLVYGTTLSTHYKREPQIPKYSKWNRRWYEIKFYFKNDNERSRTKMMKNADIGNMQVCIGCFVFIKMMYGISLRTVLFLHTSFVVSLMIINCMHKWLS